MNTPGESVRDFYRKQGAAAERERILELTKSFWCGEPDCIKHGTNWVQFIALIKGENK